MNLYVFVVSGKRSGGHVQQVARFGPQWEQIAKELGRHSITVRNAYVNSKPNSNTGRWSRDEAKRLVAIMEDPKSVHKTWRQIAAELGTRSERQVQEKWQQRLKWKPDGDELEWSAAMSDALIWHFARRARAGTLTGTFSNLHKDTVFADVISNIVQ